MPSLSIGALPNLRLNTLKNKWDHFVNSDLENLEKDKALVKGRRQRRMLGLQ